MLNYIWLGLIVCAVLFGILTHYDLYVIVAYFGSVAVRRVRHAVAAGLFRGYSWDNCEVVVRRAVFGQGGSSKLVDICVLHLAVGFAPMNCSTGRGCEIEVSGDVFGR